MHTLQIRAILFLISMLPVLSSHSLATATEWQDVAANLMSPACPGRTLLNCTSGHAEQWRELIRQKLSQGETPEQIMAYFVDMRGEEILAAPSTRGFAITAWLFPILVIINGAGIIVLLTRRWTKHRYSRQENVQTLSTHPSVPFDESSSLNPYRDRLQKDLENFTT